MYRRIDGRTPSAHGVIPRRRVPVGWKATLTKLAEAYRDEDRKLQERGNLDSCQIIGITISCYKGEQQYAHYGAEIGQALRKLVSYHEFLVKDYNMDFFRVRNVWAPILNPVLVQNILPAN